MKFYCCKHACVIFIGILNLYDSSWTIGTTPKKSSEAENVAWMENQLFFVYMTTMRNHIVIIGLTYMTCSLTVSSVLRIVAVLF